MSRMRAALGAVQPGIRAVIVALPADPAAAEELAALRILPGEEIEVVQSLPLGGPLLIRGAGGLYALGRTLADQLEVLVPRPWRRRCHGRRCRPPLPGQPGGGR